MQRILQNLLDRWMTDTVANSRIMQTVAHKTVEIQKSVTEKGAATLQESMSRASEGAKQIGKNSGGFWADLREQWAEEVAKSGRK